jgi:hypothetical protein
MKAGVLPARSMKQAKEYIEDMIGEKIWRHVQILF